MNPQPSTSTLTPDDIVRSLFRHVGKAVAVFMLVMICTVGWIYFAPAEYESVSKVYVRVGHETSTLDPSATTGQTVNIEQTLESEINSMMQILESEETARIVVAEIGADTILANDLPEEPGSESPTSAPNTKRFSPQKLISQLKDTIKDNLLPSRFSETRESLAVRRLLKNLDVWASKNSNVIKICYRAGHPKLAQMVTESLTDAFVDEHLRVSKTAGSLDFFLLQTDRLSEQLHEIEEELKRLKSSSSLVSINGQRLILEDQAKSIRTRSLANRSLLDSSRAKIKELTTILETLPERVDTDLRTAESHEGWYKLREKLFELQIREQELKSKYSERNAEVIAVVQQREEIEKILAAQSQSSSENTTSPNPTYQLFQQALLNEQAQVVSLLAEQESLKQQQQENLDEFKALNENAIRIGELERKQQVVETSYLASATKMEQAKMLEGLESAKISSISRLQDASFDVQPAGLGRLKTLLLGMFFGVILGLGFAACVEYFDRSFVTAAQVENALDLPVLVSIPQDRSQLMEVS